MSGDRRGSGDRDPVVPSPEELDSAAIEPTGVVLTVAYDGRAFAGFAPQPGQRTIAGDLLSGLRKLDAGVQELRGMSRTDAGVHARAQRVAFDPSQDLPPKAWVLGVARHLPEQLAVRRAARVDRGFVPRFRCVWKRYRYVLVRDVTRDPFWEGRAWRVPELEGEEALRKMREEAKSLVGQHDFSAYRSAADARPHAVRTLTEVSVHSMDEAGRVCAIDVQGDGFLHNMVRILVGTLVDVGRGRKPEGTARLALESRDRTLAGVTAPPDGLYLEDASLDEEGWEPFPPDPVR